MHNQQTQQNRYLQDDDGANVQKEKSPIQMFQMIPVNTLDEDILTTLAKQFKGVFAKFSYVIIPRVSADGGAHLRNWDLWGPFFMTLIYGVFINNGSQFSLLFFSVFFGATIITFNTRVLGGNISYFQSVSVLGYCLFPLFLSTLLLQILRLIQFNNSLVRFVAISVSCIWCIVGNQFGQCLAARAFISVNVSQDRKFVAMFPLVIFYVFLAVLLLYM